MIENRSPAVTALLQIITNIASPVGLVVIIAGGATIWAWRQRELWRPSLLVGAMALSFLASTLIKQLVERGRPPQIDMVPPLKVDFSFPSGHTIGIAVCLLVLGYLLYSRQPGLGRIASWIIITIIGVGSIAFSRLYLGYHWLTDVTASVGLALAIFGLVVIVDTLYRRRVKATKALLDTSP